MGVGFALQTEPLSVLAQGRSLQWLPRTCGSESDSLRLEGLKLASSHPVLHGRLMFGHFVPREKVEQTHAGFLAGSYTWDLCQECYSWITQEQTCFHRTRKSSVNKGT